MIILLPEDCKWDTPNTEPMLIPCELYTKQSIIRYSTNIGDRKLMNAGMTPYYSGGLLYKSVVWGAQDKSPRSVVWGIT